MISGSLIKDRGNVPRKLLKRHNRVAKQSWAETAVEFNENHVDRRFTESHAREAGFKRRKPKYEKRKFRSKGHRNPLEFSGDTRRAIKRSIPIVTSTSKGARIRFPAAKTFNFRHPKSQIRMNLEFRHIPSREASELANFYDRRYDSGINEG